MNRVVYSTDQGRLCPDCQQAIAACRCRQQTTAPAGDGIVRIQLETKGRKGKGVTVVRGLPLTEAELKTLAKSLKQRCGTGGAVKDFTIEIQGDKRAILEQALLDKGYRVKIAGA